MTHVFLKKKNSEKCSPPGFVDIQLQSKKELILAFEEANSACVSFSQIDFFWSFEHCVVLLYWLLKRHFHVDQACNPIMREVEN